MKKALVAIAALLVSLSAYGQGQIVFNTHVTTDTPPVDARIFNPDGTPATSGSVELDILNANGSFTPLTTDPTLPPPAFKTSPTGAGYVNAGAAQAQGVGAATVNLVLRAWQGGSTFDTATIRGQSAPFSATLAVAPNPPGDLIGATGFTMSLVNVPEPTTLALGALGLGALLIRRRK